jgi:uncharacterized membrane protein
MVERVGAYDGAFVLVNLGWVLTVVFLPFATQLTSAYSSSDRLAIAVYLGTLTLSAGFLSVAATLVWRRPALRREGVTAREAAPWAAVVTTAAFLAALVVGTAIVQINYYALLLPLLAFPVERRLRLV